MTGQLREAQGSSDGELTLTFTTTSWDPKTNLHASPWWLLDTDNQLPQRYIINKDATILFWKDGTKTIIKRSKNDNFDKRLAFLTAYFQKHCGLSKCKANKYIDDLIVESEKKEKK